MEDLASSCDEDGGAILDVECGKNKAKLYVARLCQGSKGSCILFRESWLTPNEFQFISGRQTAKDWKRSIRHQGKSLKLLLGKGVVELHPNVCASDSCRKNLPKRKTRMGTRRRAPLAENVELKETNRGEMAESDDADHADDDLKKDRGFGDSDESGVGDACDTRAAGDSDNYNSSASSDDSSCDGVAANNAEKKDDERRGHDTGENEAEEDEEAASSTMAVTGINMQDTSRSRHSSGTEHGDKTTDSQDSAVTDNKSSTEGAVVQDRESPSPQTPVKALQQTTDDDSCTSEVYSATSAASQNADSRQQREDSGDGGDSYDFKDNRSQNSVEGISDAAESNTNSSVSNSGKSLHSDENSLVRNFAEISKRDDKNSESTQKCDENEHQLTDSLDNTSNSATKNEPNSEGRVENETIKQEDECVTNKSPLTNFLNPEQFSTYSNEKSSSEKVEYPEPPKNDSRSAFDMPTCDYKMAPHIPSKQPDDSTTGSTPLTPKDTKTEDWFLSSKPAAEEASKSKPDDVDAVKKCVDIATSDRAAPAVSSTNMEAMPSPRSHPSLPPQPEVKGQTFLSDGGARHAERDVRAHEAVKSKSPVPDESKSADRKDSKRKSRLSTVIDNLRTSKEKALESTPSLSIPEKHDRSSAKSFRASKSPETKPFSPEAIAARHGLSAASLYNPLGVSMSFPASYQQHASLLAGVGKSPSNVATMYSESLLHPKLHTSPSNVAATNNNNNKKRKSASSSAPSTPRSSSSYTNHHNHSNPHLTPSPAHSKSSKSARDSHGGSSSSSGGKKHESRPEKSSSTAGATSRGLPEYGALPPPFPCVDNRSIEGSYLDLVHRYNMALAQQHYRELASAYSTPHLNLGAYPFPNGATAYEHMMMDPILLYSQMVQQRTPSYIPNPHTSPTLPENSSQKRGVKRSSSSTNQSSSSSHSATTNSKTSSHSGSRHHSSTSSANHSSSKHTEDALDLSVKKRRT